MARTFVQTIKFITLIKPQLLPWIFPQWILCSFHKYISQYPRKIVCNEQGVVIGLLHKFIIGFMNILFFSSCYFVVSAFSQLCSSPGRHIKKDYSFRFRYAQPFVLHIAYPLDGLNLFLLVINLCDLVYYVRCCIPVCDDDSIGGKKSLPQSIL